MLQFFVKLNGLQKYEMVQEDSFVLNSSENVVYGQYCTNSVEMCYLEAIYYIISRA